MNHGYRFILVSVVICFLLNSCSGPKNRCTTNCSSGNTTLSITLFDTPPTGVDLLSFTLPIAGISLKPSSGSPLPIPTTVTSVEATRLQTDSSLIVDAASVPPGNYTALNVTLGPTSATSNLFINASGSTVSWSGGSCSNAAVCTLPAGAVFTIDIPLTLTLSSGQNQWIGLNLNLNNAIVTSGGLSIDFSQPSVLTAITAPRIGMPPGVMDTVEDFTGTVTAQSSSSITVQSGISGQALTATITDNTQFDEPVTGYTNCSAAPTCVTTGSTVSVDTLLSADGTLTAREVDVLNAASVDEVEGVIYPSIHPGFINVVVADKISASGNSVLSTSSTTYGTIITLDVVTGAPSYFVDAKTLTNAPNFSPNVGFANSNDLLAGQEVRFQLRNVTSANSGIAAVAVNLLLRYSRLTGTVANFSGSTSFGFTPPSYIGVFDTVLTPPLLAYVYPGFTAFDGLSSASDLNVGGTVSIRSLFLHATQPTYAVAKVRVP